MARFGVGLVLVPALVMIAVLVTWRWGPLFGIWGWTATAAALLILAAMGLALLEELVRPPNAYGRTHHLYDLRDVPAQQQLYAASPTMLWQALPLAVVAVILIILS